MRFSDLPVFFQKALKTSPLLASIQTSWPMPKVNCQSCTMAEQGIYRLDLKCCTFIPFIPNFTAGWILQNRPDLQGQFQNFVCTPLGLSPAASYAQRFLEKGIQGFGQDPQLKCRFLHEGACQIWAARPSTCAAHFCAAAASKDFWLDLNTTLYDIEMEVAQAFLWKMGFARNKIQSCLDAVSTLQKGLDVQSQDLWLEWGGSEMEFYKEAQQFAASEVFT